MSEREIGVDPQLERIQTERAEPFGLARGNGLAREVGERCTAPEPEGRVERVRGLARPAVAERPARAGDELLEPRRVQLVRLDREPVAGSSSLEPLASDRVAEPVDVNLERLHGGTRRLLAPDVVDQALARDRLVRVGEEDDQYRALLRRSERQRNTVADGLDRAEDAEFDLQTTPLKPTSSGS